MSAGTQHTERGEGTVPVSALGSGARGGAVSEGVRVQRYCHGCFGTSMVPSDRRMCPVCGAPLSRRSAVADVPESVIEYRRLRARRNGMKRALLCIGALPIFIILLVLVPPVSPRARLQQSKAACRHMEKELFRAIQYCRLDKNPSFEDFTDPALWRSLVEGEYIKGFPQDPGSAPGSANSYVVTLPDKGYQVPRVSCSVHDTAFPVAD